MVHQQSTAESMDAWLTANCLVPAASSESAFPSNPSAPAPITGPTAPVGPAKSDALLMRMFETKGLPMVNEPAEPVASPPSSMPTTLG